MQLTKRGDYALRAMVDLAAQPLDKFILSRDVAARQNIPPKFLAQVMMDLSRAGLVRAVRGAKGGFKIMRSLSQVNVKEIVEAVEGPIALNICLIRSGACEMDEECLLYPVWVTAQKRMVEVLEDTTLEDLVKEGKGKA